jgi:hypothetical protein
MTFQPAILGAGYGGWVALQRSLPAQMEAFAGTAAEQRVAQDFRERIGGVRTAADLVADRQLLSVALGAFGLEDDLPNRAFIEKVLTEGTLSEDAFANRLTDKRYAAMAEAFGFGDFTPLTNLSGFADDILDRYTARSFERAVGAVDGSLRLALAFGPGLKDAVAQSDNPNVRWFTLMGNPPLRSVMEKALGLPDQFGRLDLDQQLATFRDRAEAVFGTADLAEIAEDPAIQDRALQLFLTRAQLAETSAASPGSVALALLGQR